MYLHFLACSYVLVHAKSDHSGEANMRLHDVGRLAPWTRQGRKLICHSGQ